MGKPGRIAAVWVSAVLAVVAAVIVFALPGPSPRKYPEREPVMLWHMWTAEWKAVVDRICDRFNESQTKYEVIPLSVPMDSADSKFLLAVAGGEPPDVMAQWNRVIPKWAESGLIVPLNDLMSQHEWAAFQRDAYPAAKRIGIYKGNLYGVTTGLNIWACYCRLDCLREAGLDPNQFPETLEGLDEWARKLHKFSPSGQIMRVGFIPQFYAMYTPGFGGGFYDWKTEKMTLSSPENLRALTYLVERRKELGFENVLRFESGMAQGIGDAQWPFIGGAYAIAVDGQWRVEQLAKFAPELEYVTKPVPPPKGGVPHYGWLNGNFMIIPKGARHVQGAWEFIKFWSGLENPERAAEFYTWGGWLPLSPAIANAPLYREYVRKHPQFQTFLDILPSENVHPAPPVPYQVYLWDRITRADESAMRGVISPEEAVKRLQGEIDQEIAMRKEFGYKD